MSIYQKENFHLKDGKKILIQSCEPKFTENYIEFISYISNETTYTMQYEGRVIPIEIIKDKWEKALKLPSFLCLGCLDNEKLIGYLAMQSPQPDHPWTKHIVEFGIMILKEYWFLGIGSKLLQIMENEAKKIGIERIEARVRAKNSNGIYFYLKNGFIIEGTRKKAVFIDGSFEDEYFIAKYI